MISSSILLAYLSPAMVGVKADFVNRSVTAIFCVWTSSVNFDQVLRDPSVFQAVVLQNFVFKGV